MLNVKKHESDSQPDLMKNVKNKNENAENGPTKY